MAHAPAREQRRITFVKGFMARGEEWVEVTIGNISDHGMMVKCDCPPAVGTRVSVRRRGAGAEGVVQWVNGRRFGMKCDGEVDQRGFVADSAAAAAPMDSAAMHRPHFVERLWHWRRDGCG